MPLAPCLLLSLACATSRAMALSKSLFSCSMVLAFCSSCSASAISLSACSYFCCSSRSSIFRRSPPLRMPLSSASAVGTVLHTILLLSFFSVGTTITMPRTRMAATAVHLRRMRLRLADVRSEGSGWLAAGEAQATALFSSASISRSSRSIMDWRRALAQISSRTICVKRYCARSSGSCRRLFSNSAFSSRLMRPRI